MYFSALGQEDSQGLADLIKSKMVVRTAKQKKLII
jgi:hypothetical protein